MIEWICDGATPGGSVTNCESAESAAWTVLVGRCAESLSAGAGVDAGAGDVSGIGVAGAGVEGAGVALAVGAGVAETGVVVDGVCASASDEIRMANDDARMSSFLFMVLGPLVGRRLI